MHAGALRTVFDKTKGHCHFCGDPLTFVNRGWAELADGHWEVDHVIQRDKGGAKSADNCLPACTRCNRLRWHRTGAAMREILFLGLLAKKEILKGSKVGRELEHLHRTRLSENTSRRSVRRAKSNLP